MNIDYELLEEQRDHLLSILWHDSKIGEISDEPVLLDTELGWGIVHLLDELLDQNEKLRSRDQNI